MRDNFYRRIIFILFSTLFFNGCSQKKIEIDLSNLPKPKNLNITQKENNQSKNLADKVYISDLLPLQNKQQILSKFEYGKKDPFSESEIQSNRLSLDLKLTGFLNTQAKKFVFVNYLGNEGAVSEKSIGGVNTNLLPEGAKVITIDLKKSELTINYENENFVFEL